MNNKEINALETRYKATALMLINLELLNGKIEDLMEWGHIAFDEGKYVLCKKALDLVGVEVVSMLEIQHFSKN